LWDEIQKSLFQEEVNEEPVQFAGVVLGIAKSENILPEQNPCFSRKIL
jgi:hypothetical protein